MVKDIKIPGQNIFDKYCHAISSDSKGIIIILNEEINWLDIQNLCKLGWKFENKNWKLDYLLIK
jgi:hypothetical protein